MPDSSSDVIRHALSTARSHGYRKVRLKAEGISLTATLSEDFEFPEEDLGEETEVAPTGPTLKEITSAHVGYLRLLPDAAVVGTTVKAGDRLGEVVALGIANELSFPCDGILVEIAVPNGEAVEYGQVIARVEK